MLQQFLNTRRRDRHFLQVPFCADECAPSFREDPLFAFRPCQSFLHASNGARLNRGPRDTSDHRLIHQESRLHQH